ncbi:hypothetical protein AJ78_04967 [Emergomyces pasteurianus Ep9510]|uniref:Uncharacterized protein n=1 Tax=Emergomyces pasteurianus Ep9510 TaxID=1447872 RepID=A0A1J9PDN3_9EURO|nr:hypothetical protein AJ78_04967 [Emergomyces pasteurianus Ep9510]
MTKEEIEILAPRSLERAIQKCARINSPNCLNFLSPPVDYSWTGWMGLAIDDLKEKVSIKTEANQGLIADGHRRVLALRLFQPQPDHWSMMIRDHSPLDQHKNCTDYLLRSEIMRVTSIIYYQMNKVRWDFSKSKYTKPELIYLSGPLIATCDPSNPSTSLTFALRAFYNLSMSCYDKATAQKVLRWILCPSNPAQGS